MKSDTLFCRMRYHLCLSGFTLFHVS